MTVTCAAMAVRPEAVVASVAVMRVATFAAARGRCILGPTQGARDLLERGEGGCEVFRGYGLGDARPDAGDDLAEPLLGGTPLFGESEAFIGVCNPAAFDETVEPVGMEGATRCDSAVHGVQQPPVSATGALGLEGAGELGGQKPVDGLQPEAEWTSVLVCVIGVHKKSFVCN